MKKILSLTIYIVMLGVSGPAISDTQQNQDIGENGVTKKDFIEKLKPTTRTRRSSRGIALIQSVPSKQPKSNADSNQGKSAEVELSTTRSIPVETSPPKISVNMTFEYNSALLTNATKTTLDNLGQAMQDEQLKPFNFIIEGHTDSTGGKAYNWELSLRRGAAVKRYLIEAHRVDPARMKVIGKGESEPIYPKNPKASGNRRVIIINAGTN